LFKYNIVPAFKTKYPEWKSPVDRSYYHNEFLLEKGILEYRCDAVALKYILRRLGVIGIGRRLSRYLVTSPP